MSCASAPSPRRRALLLAGLAAGLGPAAAAVAAPAWPEITLLDGSRLTAADWHDMAAVVVIFSTTCPFCRNHNAHVDKLHRAARGTRLRVLGAALDRHAADVQRYLQATGYGFPVTLQGDALRALFTPRRVIPTTIVVARDGRALPPVPGEMFEDDVLALARLGL